MDLRALRAFAAVAQEGGFSAAGRRIAATQPTISKAVRQLEEELGGPLLIRLGQGVALTSLGAVVLRHATAMLEQREAMLAEIAASRGLLQGRLRLGLPSFGSAVLFAPLVAAFRARFPGITIDLSEQGGRRLQEAVLAGQLDLAIALHPVPDALHWQEVRDDPLMAVLPPGHPLEGAEKIRLGALQDSAFILFEQGFALNDLIESACRRRGFAPREAARSGQADFIIALAAAGLGVAVLPRLMLESRPGLGLATALIDEPDLRWRAGMVWRRDSPLSDAARAWVAVVREHMGL
ncbi:LysR substrate-binding domain-containing protein [Roseomonas sp. 18066]|uniref:LysR substrate-binding domain-containing protein n=1 Tax=Roseomonas sp. 18066 TaxID=2681412 RepID=UPI00135C5A27|nr:LysR substrate-binding domain-containing protein [Roseomonas sp. 18066]